MVTIQVPEQRSPHPVLHVIATSVGLFVIACALDFVAVRLSASAPPALRDVASLAGIFFVAVAPFAVVLLHFCWQRPRRSNVLQALATGFLSCLIATVMIFTLGLWFHTRIGGGL